MATPMPDIAICEACIAQGGAVIFDDLRALCGHLFCKGKHYFDVLYSVPEQIKKALDANNIEIPFPHRKVIIVNESA